MNEKSTLFAGSVDMSSMERPSLLTIQVGLPRSLDGDSAAGLQPWTTAFFKSPVDGPVWLSTTNLAGDFQANQKTHGGPDKAVCVYPFEHYEFWEHRLARKIDSPGAFGENFTTLRTLEHDACIGDVLRLGEAICQISQPRPPCWKMSRCWQIPDLAAQVEQTGLTGWYLRVLEPGYVAPGGPIELLERSEPQWTIARANEILYHPERDAGSVHILASCPLLSHSWRAYLLSQRS